MAASAPEPTPDPVAAAAAAAIAASDTAGERATSVGLVRRLGLFDATMIVMGGIIGAGIFMNPAVVARQVHTPALMLGAWLVGGLIALVGAFIYAELAARMPEVGGQYVYLREAFNPSLAFVYGWALLLVTQTGGMAAVGITFSRHFLELTGIGAPEWLVATLALGLLTVVNCLGVRAGTSVQNVLMVLKILAIAMLVFCGVLPATLRPPLPRRPWVRLARVRSVPSLLSAPP